MELIVDCCSIHPTTAWLIPSQLSMHNARQIWRVSSRRDLSACVILPKFLVVGGRLD